MNTTAEKAVIMKKIETLREDIKTTRSDIKRQKKELLRDAKEELASAKKKELAFLKGEAKKGVRYTRTQCIMKILENL